MDIVININNQTNGRDKLARLIQYTSRIVWHQLKINNANKYSVDRVRNLEQQLSTFRRILRFGRCIDYGYAALNTMHYEEPWLRFTLTLSKISYSLFMYADHIAWLIKIGFVNLDSDKWNKTANRFWLLAIVANLAKDIYELLNILQMNKSMFLKPSRFINTSVPKSCYLEDLHCLFKCHKDIFIDTLRDSCDLFIPLSLLGFTKFSPSAVGVFGAVSSLASLYSILNNVYLRKS